MTGALSGIHPCETAAGRLLECCAGRLPDLSRVVVILPTRHAARPLRDCLLTAAEARGHSALLGPIITTLRDWVLGLAPPARPAPGEHARELMLVEALCAHRRLFGDADPWHLAAELLALFSELTLRGESPPDDGATFTNRIARAYGGHDGLAPLGREARLVHTLWRAWHEQLTQEGLQDRDAHYVEALSSLAVPADMQVFFIGLDETLPAEEKLIARLVTEMRAECLAYEAYDSALITQPSAFPYTAFLSAALDAREPHLAERARRLAAEHPRSPVHGRLRVCAARDAEDQALAIDLQVRSWLAEGIAPISIVCGDRRLARRLRALLERAGITLDDATGWVLSTTAAAAALESWLEAIEEDFAYQPLLDALKSPFVADGGDRESRLDAVHHLERDVILHEGVPRDLARMREHLKRRRRRLAAWAEETTQAVALLLDTVEHAAAPLLAIADDRARPPLAFLDALDESLDRLGMKAAFVTDPAGARILEELAAMRAGLAGRSIRMTWREARGWLGRVLETRYFRPPQQGDGPVRLLELAQAALVRCEGLIVAAADATRLPGGEEAQATFFNDAVRRELGLETHEDRTRRALTRFRRLLAAAPRILVSHERERDGEMLPASPWVEAIDTLHRLAWGTSLADDGLLHAVADPALRVQPPQPAPLPRQEQRPTPAAPIPLLLARLSASAHDDLIACPYRFFAARCLGLEPPEEIVETLRKSDYGNRVHRCLNAFHGGVAGLPGPFDEALTEVTRRAAIALLDLISAEVFAQDIEDNFVHRAWLVRWRRLIPAYIDWAIGRAQEWQVERTEVECARDLAGGLTLYGRLDRIDRRADGGRCVVDYKAGKAPDAREVLAGESVQLPTYALLAEGVVQAEYLLIQDQGIKTSATLSGDDLDTLAGAVRGRLEAVMERLRTGAQMPAWGAEAACRHCDMKVVCRHAAWSDQAT